jgi:hypothetical protein
MPTIGTSRLRFHIKLHRNRRGLLLLFLFFLGMWWWWWWWWWWWRRRRRRRITILLFLQLLLLLRTWPSTRTRVPASRAARTRCGSRLLWRQQRRRRRNGNVLRRRARCAHLVCLLPLLPRFHFHLRCCRWPAGAAPGRTPRPAPEAPTRRSATYGRTSRCRCSRRLRLVTSVTVTISSCGTRNVDVFVSIHVIVARIELILWWSPA